MDFGRTFSYSNFFWSVAFRHFLTKTIENSISDTLGVSLKLGKLRVFNTVLYGK